MSLGKVERYKYLGWETGEHTIFPVTDSGKGIRKLLENCISANLED